MTTLVTGGGGWIGGVLVRQLAERGESVLATVRPGGDRSRLEPLPAGVEVVELDLLDRAAVSALVRHRRPERCFHLAWYAVPGRYASAPENLDLLSASTHLAMELAAAGCGHLVGAGTEAEYDPATGYLAEDSPIRPRSLYATAKHACGELLAQIGALHEMPVTWARIFPSYGPMEDPRRLVPAVMLAQVRGEPVAVSPGEQIRDYLHVSDLASGILAAQEAGLSGPVNIGSGQPVTVGDVVRQVIAVGGRPELVDIGGRPYGPEEPMFLCSNVSRLRSTGWHPRYDLPTGIAETFEWWQAQAT